MDNMPGRYKRKQYFVAAKFQVKYIGIILALMFLTAAMCSYVVYYTTMVGMGEKLASVYPQGRLISIVKMVNSRIFLSLILVTPLVIVLGVFLSHKIAGPIFRMEKFLDSVASGDLSVHITLRERDELVKLADGINRVIDSLKETVMKKRGHVANISIDVSKLRMVLNHKPVDAGVAGDLAEKIGSELDKLNIELDRYKLERQSPAA